MARKVKKPIFVFVRTVLPHWGDLMTGRYSAPIVVLAGGACLIGLFGTARSGFNFLNRVLVFSPLSLVLIGGLVAVYLTWKYEYEKNLEWKEKFRPKLRASFDMNNFACVRPGTEVYQRHVSYGDNRSLTITGIVPPHTLVPTMRMVEFGDFPKPEFFATYYRLRVNCDGINSVANCFGRLESISKSGAPIHHWEPTILPFAQSERENAACKKIHKASPAFLDFMFISDDNRAGLTSLGFIGASSIDWRGLFAESGLYVLRINILSDTPTIAVDVSFNWTGDRATSQITCREASL